MRIYRAGWEKKDVNRELPSKEQSFPRLYFGVPSALVPLYLRIMCVCMCMYIYNFYTFMYIYKYISQGVYIYICTLYICIYKDTHVFNPYT